MIITKAIEQKEHNVFIFVLHYCQLIMTRKTRPLFSHVLQSEQRRIIECQSFCALRTRRYVDWHSVGKCSRFIWQNEMSVGNFRLILELRYWVEFIWICVALRVSLLSFKNNWYYHPLQNNEKRLMLIDLNVFFVFKKILRVTTKKIALEFKNDEWQIYSLFGLENVELE